MKLSVVIAGGRMKARSLAYLLKSRGCDVTLITRDAAFARSLAFDHAFTVIYGDASKSWVLEQAGAGSADTLIALSPKDEDNLVICEMGRQLFSIPKTISLISDRQLEPLFRQAGVDFTVNAASMIAGLIDHQIVEESLSDQLLFETPEGNPVRIISVTLSRHAPVCNKTLEEITLPKQTVIGSILRGSELEVPHGQSRLQALDTLIVLTRQDQVDEAVRTLTGEPQ